MSTHLLEKAREATEHRQRLAQAAGLRAIDLGIRREASRRATRRQIATIALNRLRRTAHAVLGVEALSALGRSAEVQALLATSRSGALTLWGVEPRLKGWANGLLLTKDAVLIYDHIYYGDSATPSDESITLRLPYAGDALIYQRVVTKIYSSPIASVEKATAQLERDPNSGEADERAIFFQVLVDCGEPSKLEQYFTAALRLA
jgi:hypothetical protein